MDAFPSTRDEYAFVLWCQFASTAMGGLMEWAGENRSAKRLGELAECAAYAADELLEQAEFRWPVAADDEPGDGVV